tara:strand:- start:153 stop:500 length:348 start_codon:yes stop_codon:yes gene_type:complete
MRTMFIGDDVFNLLPEEEKKNFELFKTYTPEFIKEQDDDWFDECFSEPEHYEDFFGSDWESRERKVYKRDYENYQIEETKWIWEYREKIDGEQYSVSLDSNLQADDDDYDVDWEV